LRGDNQQPLFAREFLEHLRSLKFACDIDAIPEGTVVFPHEPLVRVQGPIVQCQLLESFLLNVMNFQTLIATKAARICQAALTSSTGSPVRLTRIVSPTPSASRAPMPTALLIVPLHTVPASVTPTCSGASVRAASSR
jgi:hypothetical protein